MCTACTRQVSGHQLAEAKVAKMNATVLNPFFRMDWPVPHFFGNGEVSSQRIDCDLSKSATAIATQLQRTVRYG
jgi:hypothetical protein